MEGSKERNEDGEQVFLRPRQRERDFLDCIRQVYGRATRTHVLDPSGLRMFDTVEKDFSVRGESRELGVCRLPHRWT